MFKTGDIIDERYEIKEQIGSGGGGIIYKAYHCNMRKDVALKLIKDASAEELANRSEIDLMKNLKSKYLPIFYDFVQNNNEIYTVMEYIDGHDIKRLVEMGKDFSEDEVFKCGIQLCEAVAELHSMHPPIIHGDIKPSNVMITATGDVCLIDFNISAIMQGNKAAAKGYSKEYAAPEQTVKSKKYKQYVTNPIEDEFHEETRFLLNETTDGSNTYTKTLLDSGSNLEKRQSAQAFIDFRTDIFGIGAVLYYMMTGHPPVNGQPDFSGTRVSVKLKRIISKAMSNNPSERYSNTSEMEADLCSEEPEQENKSVRKSRGKLFVSVAGIAAVIAVIAIVCIEKRNESVNTAIIQSDASKITTTASTSSLTTASSVAETTEVPETTASITKVVELEDDLVNPVIEYGFDSSLWGKTSDDIKSMVSLKADESVSGKEELRYNDVEPFSINEFDGSLLFDASISKYYYFDYTLSDSENICVDGLYRVMYYVRYNDDAERTNSINKLVYDFTSVYGESETIDSDFFEPNESYKYIHWINDSTVVLLETWSNLHAAVEFVSADAINFEPINESESTISSIVTTTVPITTETVASTKVKEVTIGKKSYPIDIQTLDLSNMNLYSSDLSHLPEFTRLEKLNLSGNNITDFSPIIKVKTLRGLDISNNPISELPYDLLSLPELTYLNASDTDIGGIYNGSLDNTYPANLKYLNVRNTNVRFIKFSESLDGTVYFPTKFESLAISNAPYLFLAPDQGSFHHLESFEISYNSLTGAAGPRSDLKTSLSELYDLKELYIISDSKLTDSQIEEIQGYINSDCKIYINKFYDFPDVMSDY